ncbi:MAG: hypothetical protein AB1641_21330 [Thermodesulfobacteriota bacterium]
MSEVFLANDGSILTGRSAPAGAPLVYLGGRVELAPDYTLRGYFRMLEKYPLLAGLNEFIPALQERYRAAGDEPPTVLERLEFGKNVEMIGFPGQPRLEIYTALRGVSGRESFDLRAYRLESLLDLPLRLGGLRHIILGDRVDLLEFGTVFLLFEFIEGLAWDLSFAVGSTQCELRR